MTKDPTEVSWYQQNPEKSLALIDDAFPGKCGEVDLPKHIVDIGGGASTLVDRLVEKSNIEVCVLDIASCALDHAKKRLGDCAQSVNWIVADISEPVKGLSDEWADVWHDRAVFHFLTTPEQRLGYARNFARILRPGGAAVIATFALDGPNQCSDLEVCRHDGASILNELSATRLDLTLEKEEIEEHITPWGAVQSFVYALIRRN